MFIIQFNLDEISGCKEWQLFDTTGDTTNGWSDSGNPARSDNSTITFYILQNKFTVGYLITLTTVAGVITAFTITDPAGLVTDWFPTLAADTPAFTSDPTLFFSITPPMIGLLDTDSFDSDGYYFEENITIAGVTYTADANQAIVCSLCCCLQKKSGALNDCGCQDNRASELTWAWLQMDAATIAMNNNDVQKSVDMINGAKKICENDCGC